MLTHRLAELEAVQPQLIELVQCKTKIASVWTKWARVGIQHERMRKNIKKKLHIRKIIWVDSTNTVLTHTHTLIHRLTWFESLPSIHHHPSAGSVGVEGGGPLGGQ